MKADYKRKAPLVHVVFRLTIFMIFMKAKATARTTTDAIKTTRGTDFHANKTEETNKFTHEGPTDKVVYTSVTKTSTSEDAVTSDKPGMLKGTDPMPIIIAIVCLLVLIIIIVVIVVLIKRKRKKSQLNANSNPAKLSVVSHDVDDTAYEEIATNGDRTYEKFVPSGSEDVDKHTYAGLVTKIEAPTYLQLI